MDNRGSAYLLTPLHPGAIAVITVETPDPRLLAQILDAAVPIESWECNRIRRAGLRDEQGTFDEALVTVTRSGEEQWCVEICAHGSVRVVQRLMGTLERLGLRCETEGPPPATLEQHAWAALAKARTRRSASLVAECWRESAARLGLVRDLLLAGRANEAADQLRALTRDSARGQRWIEGFRVALVGPANAGKTTLANRLAGREQGLVADLAGTTRDWVEYEVALGGVPVTVIDTAGALESDDPVDRAAAESTSEVVRTAEVRLLVIDGSQPLDEQTARWLGAYDEAEACGVVLTKADRGVVLTPESLADRWAGRCVSVARESDTSAVERLACRLAGLDAEPPPPPFLWTGELVQWARQAEDNLRRGGPGVCAAVAEDVSRLLG